MIETGRFGRSAAAGVGHGPPSRFWRALVSFSAAMAALAWAFWEFAGRIPWGGLGAAVGTAIFLVWRAWRDKGLWAEQRAVDRALREHRDPGPAHRAAVDRCARERRAGRSRAEGVLVQVILGGPAAACVAVAAYRSDPAVALPGIALAALAVSIVRLSRREEREAHRWLADPPHPRDEERRS